MTTQSCFLCGRNAKVYTRNENGDPICGSCYERTKSREVCHLCGHTRRIASRTPDGPVCKVCRRRLTFRSVWTEFKRGAQRRGWEVSISVEEFRSIVESRCHYCGDPPDGTLHRFLGVDRLDSTIGYIPGNCVPSCWPCNLAKNAIGYLAFLALCRKVAKQHPTDPDLPSAFDGLGTVSLAAGRIGAGTLVGAPILGRHRPAGTVGD